MPPKKEKVIEEPFNFKKYNFTLTKKPRETPKKCIYIDEGNTAEYNQILKFILKIFKRCSNDR